MYSIEILAASHLIDKNSMIRLYKVAGELDGYVLAVFDHVFGKRLL